MGMRVTIQAVSRVLIGLNVAVFALAMFGYFKVQQSQSLLVEAYESKYQSYLLADELRQSSDDLTRLVRTYVVTGDPAYEQHYYDVLAIRGGKKPRPANYNRIYWDFVAAGESPPDPPGQTISLRDLMKQMGFTSAEFALLSQATNKSKLLAKSEIQAMNAVKGLFADEEGNYTIQSEPDFKLARDILHSEQYHKDKATIMKPVDIFYQKLEQRTRGEIDARISQLYFWEDVLLGVLFVLLGTVGALAYVLSRRIVHPLIQLKTSMDVIASGRLDQEIPYLERKDELGSMAQGVQIFRQNSAKLVENKQREEKQRALNAAQKAKDMKALANQFQGTIVNVCDNLGGVTTQLQERSLTMQNVVNGTLDQAGNVKSLASMATKNVATVAAAVTQLSTSISEVSEQLKLSSNIANQAVDRATQSQETVEKLVGTSEKIGDIMSLIMDIADQTNLLALNATIEAARAGDAGKGFAIVAAEVKDLASQTMRATEEISVQVTEVQDVTKNTADSIAEITKIIRQINQIATSISGTVAQQDKTTREISTNLNDASTQANDVSKQSDTMTQSCTETNSGTQEVLQAINILSERSKELETTVHDFIEYLLSQSQESDIPAQA